MLQSVLSNLGILLLMHLVINTCYYFVQVKKLPEWSIPYLHVLSVAGAVIGMAYFPINYENHIFDLRIAPLIFLAFFHGWKYTLPVLLLVTLHRVIAGSHVNLHEILFGTIIPTIIPLFFYPLDHEKTLFVKPFVVTNIGWILSDLSMIWMFPQGWEIFKEIAVVRYLSLMLGSLILYLFIISGRKHLELTKKLQFFAERDPLTGLFNMRKFEENICEYEETEKYTYLAMVDIDRFKKINDSYGHQIGDTAIQLVGRVISRHLDEHTFAARYGGDEYIFFLAVDYPEQALIKLENIRKEVMNEPFPIDLKLPRHTISLSIGVGELIDNQNIKQAIEAADKQLYLAKKTGRNKVCS